MDRLNFARDLMGFAKKQFIDVIHWTEEDDGVLAYRYPMQDFEIQNGAKLTVRDSQIAVFVDQGQVADIFGPGLYTLNTQTLPVLTNLKNWDKLFASPFKSDVYFFSTRLQLDRKWGTPNPITIRDKDFGMVRMRAFGIYSYKMTDPSKFYKEVSGTRERYTVDDVDGQLRNLVIAGISGVFGESGVPFIDMAANQTALAEKLRERLIPAFERYGLTLDMFAVQNVSLPDELQQMLDKRIGINIVGGMQAYTQMQTADAIPLAAQNEGGFAGIGAGIGAGLGVGQAIGQAVTQSLNPNNPGVAAAPQPAAASAMGGALASTAVAGAVPGATSAPSAAPAADPADEIVATLEKLHGLVTKGILTQDEFNAKKAELLSKLS